MSLCERIKELRSKEEIALNHKRAVTSIKNNQ